LTSDIREDGSGWYFDFNKNDDKSLKTPSSVRSTPMHSEIVRLGFLDYVAARKAAGDIRLWPDLRPDSQRPSVQFSRWFREEIRRKANLPEFHALRHTVETRLVEARVHPEIRDRLLGHANRGSEGGRTYAHPREVLRSSMEQLAYPGLSIRRAYRSVHSSAQVEPL
jgi:integrase